MSAGEPAVTVEEYGHSFLWSRGGAVYVNGVRVGDVTKIKWRDVDREYDRVMADEIVKRAADRVNAEVLAVLHGP